MGFRLMSPGDGAYRIELSQVDGEEAVETILAGENDEIHVDLPSGEYWGRITELGQPAESERLFKLQLKPNEAEVRLPSIQNDVQIKSFAVGELGPAISSTRLPRISQLIESKSHERPPIVQGGLIAPFSKLTFRSTNLSTKTAEFVQESRSALQLPSMLLGIEPELWETPWTLALHAAAHRLSFVIGVSEDHSPKKKGNWTRPSLTQIRTEKMDDGFRFCLHPNQHRECIPKSGYRLRMTIGIAGVPAIRVPVPIYAEGTIIEVKPVRIGDQLDVGVEIKAINRQVQALVAALTELPGDEALKILRWNSNSPIKDAIEILANKQHDLWAATAAALLLVKARHLDDVEEWLQNLFRLAPHIADAGIAASWARAAQGTGGRRCTEQSVMEFLNQGLTVGAPTFSVGNSLALEMLSILRSSAEDENIRSTARTAYVRVARRSRYRIYRGPYMLWEQIGRNLQSGRLLGPRYLELVRGVL